ncbi:MAG TPA: MFS transporter [Candidatus Paceibacterota bacterium]|nr:MFS transporter [Candidatus Paceibacterota bacterium]
MSRIKIKRMYVISFLFALHIAIGAYINSTFLVSIIKEEKVGLLYTIASALILLILSKSSGILKIFGNKRLILAFLTVNMLSLVGLIASRDPIVIGTSFVLFMATNTLVFFCIDIFIEHFGNPSETGKTRGLQLTLLNLAYMISPLIAAFFIARGGYQAVYIVSFIIVVLMTLELLFSVKSYRDKKYIRQPFWETYKYLLKNQSVLSIVLINFLLQFFYAWMVVYTPIYLYEHMMFGWGKIGVIFTIMLSPFVLLGLPVGTLIDKYHFNKKTLLYLGFIILCISTAGLSFIVSSNIFIWAIVLFATRIGASIIETTSEVFFFEKISEKDTNLLSIFRDMFPVAYIIAPLIASIVFFFAPLNNYFFMVLAVIMVTGFYYIYKIKNGKISN